jgi:hypothetical protein
MKQAAVRGTVVTLNDFSPLMIQKVVSLSVEKALHLERLMIHLCHFLGGLYH